MCCSGDGLAPRPLPFFVLLIRALAGLPRGPAHVAEVHAARASHVATPDGELDQRAASEAALPALPLRGAQRGLKFKVLRTILEHVVRGTATDGADPLSAVAASDAALAERRRIELHPPAAFGVRTVPSIRHRHRVLLRLGLVGAEEASTQGAPDQLRRNLAQAAFGREELRVGHGRSVVVQQD